MEEKRDQRPKTVKKAATSVAVIQWEKGDGISEIIADELSALGYIPVTFLFSSSIPEEVSFVFSFGPYGDFLRAPYELAKMPPKKRPKFIHWNTEGLPDLRIPRLFMRAIGRVRSRLDPCIRLMREHWARQRMLRFRYIGDYYRVHAAGLLDVFADSSAIYARWHARQGLPTVHAPWGGTPRWYRQLHLERDIDVLWMGGLNSRRRNRLLAKLCPELTRRGMSVHLADGLNNPFIFGDERIEFLNRSKITLNLTRTWYDDNFSRFAIAAPNSSLVISEPMLPHSPRVIPGVHYVEAPIEQLADQIEHYLAHEDERQKIAENAFALFTEELSFSKSIADIMAAAEQTRAGGER